MKNEKEILIQRPIHRYDMLPRNAGVKEEIESRTCHNSEQIS